MPAFNPPLSEPEILAAFAPRFRDARVLKSGGQGAVFRAEVGPGQPEKEGTVIALKIYYADQVEARTKREVEAISQIKAESLVEYVGSGQKGIRGLPCFWLETGYVDGESLAAVLAKGALTVAQVAQVTTDVALALIPIWDRRIVHRDIKPDNIMIRLNGHAVLIDLGVARHLQEDSLTTQGKTWGTEGYLSPEQSRAVRALTCKSDVFALGLVAQECLLGRHPTARRQNPLIGGGPSTASLTTGVDPQLVALIDRMVHRDPVRRPTPAEVEDALKPFLASGQGI